MTELSIRLASPEDKRLVWLWRNDETTRRFSFDQAPIDWSDHSEWFDSVMSAPDRHLLIVEAAGRSVAVVRLDRTEGGSWAVSINVDPMSRGEGWGPMALEGVADWLRHREGPARLHARVKVDNRSSLRAFEKAGFRLTAMHEEGVELVKEVYST